MGRFLEMLATEPGKVSYGKKDVKDLIVQGAVEILLVSEDLDEEIIEDFENECQKVGSEVKIISTETREGVQLKNLGMIGAILRYAMND
jgi:stalled ribosome rescue protein Dom34